MRAGGLVATLAVAGAAVVALANRPEILGMLTNADLLLPAAFASDVIGHGAAAWQFQLPRAPSLVPDIAAMLLLQATLGGWRMAMLAYAVGAFMALVAAGGAIAAQLADRSLAAGAATVLALTATLLGVLWPSEVTQPFLMSLAPAVHSGSLILALGALLLARATAWRQRADVGRLASLGVLATVGMLSDKLFAGAFLPPLLAALGVSVWQGYLARPLATRVAAVALAGVAAGWAADRLLFAYLLRREPDIGLLSADTPDHLRLFLHQPMLPFLVVATVAIWSLPLWVRRRTPARVFWWSAISVTPPSFLALTALLYVDHTSMRYAQAALWLPLFAAAGLLLLVPAAGRIAAVGTAFVAAWAALQPWPGPAILAWRDPLAACLQQARAAGSLHDGLAGYWLARPVEASADWSLQVEQITPDGDAYPWGNNRRWYTHARDDPNRSPNFDFIVAAQLDAPAIASRYGAPASTLSCPGSEVWLYSSNWLRLTSR